MNENESESGKAIPIDYTWMVSSLMLSPILQHQGESLPTLPTLNNLALKLLGKHSLNQYEYKTISNIYHKLFEDYLSHFAYDAIANFCLEDFGKIDTVLNGSKDGIDLKLFAIINPDLEQLTSQGYDELSRRLASRWLNNLKYAHKYFSPYTMEKDLRLRILQWITSPHLKKEHWLKWWKLNNDPPINLEQLRCQFHSDANGDRLFLNFKHALNAMDNFTSLTTESTQKLNHLINDTFALEISTGNSKELGSSIKNNLNENRIVVEQKVMLLSKAIISLRMKKKPQELVFVAKHVLFIDCDLENSLVHGTNVAILAGTVVVSETREINVSGQCGCFAASSQNHAYHANPVTNTEVNGEFSDFSNNGDAPSSWNNSEGSHECYDRIGNDETVHPLLRGIDGRDGAAGESSGNVTILSNSIWNPENLTVKLNGGDGRGGQDGGKGGDGIDGKGMLKEELDKLIPTYTSIFFNLNKSETFRDHTPDGFTRKQSFSDEDHSLQFAGGENYTQPKKLPKYYYNVFEDNSGRHLEFSFSSWKKHSLLSPGSYVETFDLFLIAKGSPGKQPGAGGRGGQGGSGGRSGQFTALTATGSSSPFYGIVVLSKSGRHGVNGQNGQPGKPAQNGNDIGIIDRSDMKASKFYIGEDGTKKLTTKYFKNDCEQTRFCGYLCHQLNNEECFVRFEAGERDIIRAVDTEYREHSLVKKECSTKIKTSIVTEELLTEFSYVFEQNVAPTEVEEVNRFAKNISEKKEEVVEEQIAFLRELKWSHRLDVDIRTTWSSELDKNDILEKINAAGAATDEELVQLWTDIFSFNGYIPTPRLEMLIRTMEQSPNGNTEWKTYLQKLRIDWNDKKSILTMKPISFNKNLEKQGTHEYVTVQQISPEFLEWNKAETVTQLTSELEVEAKKYRCSKDVLDVLRQLHQSLKDDAAAFEPFRDDNLDWSDSQRVREHLAARQQAERRTSQPSRRSVFQDRMDPMVGIRTIAGDSQHPVHQQFERLERLKASLPDVCALLTLHDQRSSQYGNYEPTTVGSNCQSIIYVYFRSSQILDFNRRLESYNEQMKTGGGFATWVVKFADEDNSGRSEYEPATPISDGLVATSFVSNDNDELLFSNLRCGIRSPAYLQLIADLKNVNIEVYRKMPGSKVQLVKNINQNGLQPHRILFDDKGNAFRMESDDRVDDVRNMILASKGNCPISETAVDFSRFVPSTDAAVIQLFSDAVFAERGSNKFLRCLQRIFELFGFHMSTMELIFIINTYIDLACNFQVDTDSLCVLYCKNHHRLTYLSLELRLWMTTRLHSDNIEVSQIEDGRIAALLGSRLHEVNEEYSQEEQFLEHVLEFSKTIGHYTEVLEKTSFDEWISSTSGLRSVFANELQLDYGEATYHVNILKAVKTDNASEIIRIVDKLKTAKESVSTGFLALITTLLQKREYENFTLTRHENSGKARCIGKQGHLQSLYTFLEKLLKYDPRITNEDARIAELRRTEEWNYIFPGSVRSREELERLSICESLPKQKMQTIFDIMSNPEDLEPRFKECAEMLNAIDYCLKEKRNIRLRDTQKIAILSAYFHDGNLLSQVTTGEGKTYIIVALSIMYVLLDKPAKSKTVDVITSSSVLAKRDALENKDIYNHFGIEVSHNCDEDVEQRKIAYKANVVYGDVGSFQRDFLLDEYYQKSNRGSRQNDYVIVDEVDSMLLDHGNHMLYLSHTIAGIEKLEPLFVFIYKRITETIEDNNRILADLTETAVLSDIFGMVTVEDIEALDIERGTATVAWEKLVKIGIIDGKGVVCDSTNDHLNSATDNLGCANSDADRRIQAMLKMVKERQRMIDIPTHFHEFIRTHLHVFVENAIRSTALRINDEYVIDVDRSECSSDVYPVVTIIDKGTGTDLYSSQWNDGLHQFLQLDNGCRISPVSCKAIFVSNVSYFKGYKKINGFSGTLGSAEESKCLHELYNAEMVKIPTWKAKMFAEEAPIVVPTATERIEQIYVSLKNKLHASRSVLVICSSIAEVDETYSALRVLCEKDVDCTQIANALNSARIYRRDFESFDIDKKGLETHKLIFSTNLAGRGTDIKLSKDLEAAGGLHVIIGLSENRRIQEQAFGRTARCGNYGTGQIIALDENIKTTDIFRLQQQRDFRESHRLQQLKKFYENNTEMQEWCLTEFAKHSKNLRMDINSQGNRIADIVYSALRDEWALWLDSEAETIVNCRSRADNSIKLELQSSLKLFLEEKDLSCFVAGESLQHFSPPEWIHNPLPLIQLALALFEQKMIEKSVKILLQVQRDFPQFMGETSYYLGVILQQHKKIENNCTWKINLLTSLSKKWSNRQDAFLVMSGKGHEEVVSNAVKNLLQMARTHFTLMIEEQEQMCATIQSLVTGSRNTGGYLAQKQEQISTLYQYIKSIDIVLGGPINSDKLMSCKESSDFSAQRKALNRAGVLSSFVLQDVVSREHLITVAKKHYLQPSMLVNLLKNVAENDTLPKFEGRNTVDVLALSSISMPNAMEFWEYLQKFGIITRARTFLVVKNDLEWDGILETIDRHDLQLRLTDIGPSPVKWSTTDWINDHKCYAIDNIKQIENDSRKNAQIHEWIEARRAYIEIVGTINPTRLAETPFFGKFDFITASILENDLGLLKKDAEWILTKLLRVGILEMVNYYGRRVYTLKQRINLNSLPENMREALWNVFTRNFCYRYAVKTLQAIFLEGSTLSRSEPSILLPVFPYKVLFEDLVSYGIIVESRVTETALIYLEEESGPLTKLYYELTINLPMTDSCTIGIKTASEYMRDQGIISTKMSISWSNLIGAIAVVYNKWISEHKQMAIRKRFLSLFSVGLLVPNKYNATIDARFGTTNYYMEIIKRNQQSFADSTASLGDEFSGMILSHQKGVKLARQAAVHKTKMNVTHDFITSAVIRIHRHILKHAFVTHNEIEVAHELLANCVRDCLLLPMLQQSLEAFILHYLKLEIVNFLRHSDKEDSGKVPLIQLPLLRTIALFARAVVKDVNKSRSSDFIDVKSVSSTTELTAVLQEQILAMENTKQLNHLLPQEIHKRLEKIYDEVLHSQALPMAAKLLLSWEENGFAPLDRTVVSERTPIKITEDITTVGLRYPHQLRDIHNIFLKISYLEQKKEVVGHMVRHNFPLGVHCASRVISGVATLLEKLKSPLQHIHLSLLREGKEVLMIKLSMPDGEELSEDLQLSLANNCFFAGCPSELYQTNNKNNSLLNELKSKIPVNFGSEDDFLTSLADCVCNSSFEVELSKWFHNENLRCAVRL